MRSRNIKPDFFRDYQLCQLDIFARVLFSGLWCLADREGRLEDCPPRIRADVFPYDDVNIEKLLESLAASEFITRYTVKDDPRQYIQIKNFHKHQNPHKNEKPSEIPAVEQRPVITRANQEITRANRADSLNLIPDSLNLIPDSSSPVVNNKESKSENQKTDDDDFLDMNQLNALAVRHLGWNPVLTPGRAEHLRKLTQVFKDDVCRGFEAAAAAGSTSINYVIKASQERGSPSGMSQTSKGLAVLAEMRRRANEALDSDGDYDGDRATLLPAPERGTSSRSNSEGNRRMG